jgi:hypothetical protein
MKIGRDKYDITHTYLNGQWTTTDILVIRINVSFYLKCLSATVIKGTNAQQ